MVICGYKEVGVSPPPPPKNYVYLRRTTTNRWKNYLKVLQENYYGCLHSLLRSYEMEHWFTIISLKLSELLLLACFPASKR